MSRWKSDPDKSADALAADLDLDLAAGSRVLLVDASRTLPAILAPTAWTIETWDRRLSHGRAPTIAPPDGPFDAVLFRLCKSKDELGMRTRQAFAMLNPGRPLLIYGGNDEGIRSVGARLKDALGPFTTLSTYGHGRVEAATRHGHATIAKSAVFDWKQHGTMRIAGAERPWISYPGLFADGALDPATELLLHHIADVPASARVLDYGCGSGLIAATILSRQASAKVTAVDIDTIALLAVSENVPEARVLLSDRLKSTGRHDLIVSNPPIHNGFREDYGPVHRMIEDAPLHLLPRGRLIFVVQRRVPVEAQLKAKFETVDVLADQGPFRVWSAMQPSKRAARTEDEPVEIVDDTDDW